MPSLDTTLAFVGLLFTVVSAIGLSLQGRLSDDVGHTTRRRDNA